ncbi:hypothetical protein G6F35_016867 [Rhizopus arrhizus]|nr:hypothetical protein G6F35_016867 [Rhizopus arrhizus]
MKQLQYLTVYPLNLTPHNTTPSFAVTLMQDIVTVENGLTCWNTELAYGIPTYNAHTRFSSLTGNHYRSIIDLFLSTQELHNAHLRVHDDISLGSDHSPLTLSCLVPPPPALPNHPRLLWNLSRLSEHDCTYVQLFKDKIRPFLQLLQEYTSTDGVYTSFGSVRWPQEP